MTDLTNLCNDKYKLLEYLEDKEEYQKGMVITKASQDELATKMSISKHKVAKMIKELIKDNYLIQVDQKGKYHITKSGHKAIYVLGEGKRKKKASHFKCASLFAGVGGIDLGFKNIGFETVYANEIDPKAKQTYEYNFELNVDCRDIHEVVNDLNNNIDPFNKQNFNILLAGFPCQAFSIAGYREGFNDKKGRGGLFFEIMKIVRLKKPDVIFLENVKNLVNHDNGKTFQIIYDALKSEKYHIKEEVLNSMEYGNVPQNRERIYIVAFKDEAKKDKFHFPFPVELDNTLDQVIDYKHKLDDKFYYTENFKHYDELKEKMTKQDTVYQWRRVYVRENKNNVCPTLTANMGTGGHNVPLVLTNHGIRKLTPKECFALQGFGDKYKLPPDIAISHLYKQAGNSVSVSVIEKIAYEILRVL